MIRKLIVVMIIAIIVFASLNTGAFANTESSGNESLINPPKKSITVDTLVKNFDNLVKVSQECFMTVEKGMRSEGVIGYTRKHLDVFLPIILFLVLYLGWLRRRARE